MVTVDGTLSFSVMGAVAPRARFPTDRGKIGLVKVAVPDPPRVRSTTWFTKRFWPFPVPLFFTVMVKVKVVPDFDWLVLRIATPGRPIPTPLRETACWLPFTPLLLSVMVRVPVSGPVAVGVKVTLIVQEPLAATLPPQLLVSPKFALVAMPLMVSAALPVLLRVTACDPLVVPRG